MSKERLVFKRQLLRVERLVATGRVFFIVGSPDNVIGSAGH